MYFFFKTSRELLDPVAPPSIPVSNSSHEVFRGRRFQDKSEKVRKERRLKQGTKALHKYDIYQHSFFSSFYVGNKQIYHQLFLSTLPPVQVLESPSFQKVQRAEPTPAQPLNLHHLPHSLRGHAEDYLGGRGEVERPSSRTRSPHTLKLR